MTADPVGGVWSYAMGLAGAMGGTEFLLVAMGGALSEAQRTQAAALPNLTLEETRFRLEWMDDPWEDVDAAGDHLLTLAEQFSPDLVHLNGYVHAALPWQCPVLIVAHSCVLSWWQAVKGEAAPSRYNEYRDRVRRGLEAATDVVAPTMEMLGSLRANYGDPQTGRVIYNGISPFCGRTPKEPFIFAAGRLWDPAKNFALLDQVAGHLPWKVLVAGECKHPGGLHTMSLPHLNLLGLISPLDSWYQRASIYALPVRYEPFGLSILEAARAGCALVIGDVPSLRELWQEAAFYVSPDEPALLLDLLRSLIDSPKLRAEMGERAREQAARYSLEAMGQAYQALYREMIGTGCPQPAAALASRSTRRAVPTRPAIPARPDGSACCSHGSVSRREGEVL